MIRLIVTENDELYARLCRKARTEGDSVRRATDVLDGYRQARGLEQEAVVIVDMSLATADTLLEALHSRKATAHIPLLAIQCDHRPLPLGLRRLCIDVIEAETLPPMDSS